MLPLQRPSVGVEWKDPARPLERLVLQVQLMAASVRDGCAPRKRTDTHTNIPG